MWIKRDDLTGAVLSGNKARKLEFLLADAARQGADVIITCGGIQSNHSRATAAAAREAGMDCHLLLNHAQLDQDPGLAEAAAKVEARIAGRGRILLRPSGTEPLLRVMVEGEDADEVVAAAEELAQKT